MKKSVLLLTTALILLIEPALAMEENFGRIPIPHDPAAMTPPAYDPATDPAMMATMPVITMPDPAAMMASTYDPATDPAMMATMRDP
ncbi:MAG: hypothetical protein JSR85_03815, partial [Proteobacteria bacterium]|nr:hypothetical protein [Pseudomonadota bacterium]